MRINTYVHGSKETNRQCGEEGGLKGKALDEFTYAAYELELVYDVDPVSGKFKLVEVDGRKLD